MRENKPLIYPIGVVIGDVHLGRSTKALALYSLEQAAHIAEEMNVSLFINGDLTNDKVVLRSDWLNGLIKLLDSVKSQVKVIINVGNHDRINEKDKEHSLECLKPYAQVIDQPGVYFGIAVIPYCSTNDEFLEAVSRFPKSQIILVHQGIKGAFMGDYVQDKSSVSASSLAGRRIIANHYHRRQLIALPEGGSWQYIGSPYTITHTEANDGPKGFSVAYSDGSTELFPLDLRKHVRVDRTVETMLDPIPNLKPCDILRMKVSGPYTELSKVSKRKLGLHHLGHNNYELDRDYQQLDTNVLVKPDLDLTNDALFDAAIGELLESDERKTELKTLWRELLT